MTNLFVLTLAALLPPFLAAQPGRFALPACIGEGLELADRTCFLLCHDSTLKVSRWTAHELQAEHLNGGEHAARPSHFRKDRALAGNAARDTDYRGSGFARGHMVPAADLAWSEEAIRSTFLLSNALPQQPAVNSGNWRRLEAAVRGIAACSDFTYVITGPIFNDPDIEHIGEGVAVPTHTFKVVLAIRGEQKVMYAAVVPNAAPASGVPLSSLVTTVADVERLSGLDFFRALARSSTSNRQANSRGIP